MMLGPMNMRHTCVAMLAVLLLCSCTANAMAPHSFVLADRNKPLATIVVSRDFGHITRQDSYAAMIANQWMKQAVDELQHYIELATGARLPIVTDGEKVEGCAIHIGQTDFVKAAKLDLGSLKYAGYIITSSGNNILICGRPEEGTINGIYGFLRDQVGVRWFMPGDLWEVVPKTQRLVVNIGSRPSNPDFAYRAWPHVFDQWTIRNRLTIETKGAPYFPFGHNLQIFPASIYGKDHPEYYPYYAGERHVPWNGEDCQPCLTNPDVIRLTVEAIQKYFADYPEASQYSICVNDSLTFCLCPKCAALDSPYRSFHGLRSNSDSYYWFVDQVARQIAKSNPGKTLGCYAYICAVLPPRIIKRLPDNVAVMVTQDTSQYRDPNYKRDDQDLIRQWGQSSSHVLKYDYYGVGWFSPRYFPHLAAEDLKYLHDHNGVGQFAEIYAYWAIMSPQVYMASQLLWDVHQNPDDLLNEYFTGLYGNVAPTMKEFYSTLEGIWMKPFPGEFLQGGGDINGEVPSFDVARMDKARRLLDKAYAESEGIKRERVEYIRDSFRFSYLVVTGYDTAMSMKTLPLKNRADLDHLAAEMKRTLRLINLAERTRDATMGKDPRYSLNVYYKDGCYGQDKVYSTKLLTWEKLLTDAVKEQLIRANAWAKSNMNAKDADEFTLSLESQLAAVEIRQTVDWREKVE